MANEKHVELLKSGIEVWNKWRKENPDKIPDLECVDFSQEDFTDADFSRAKLSCSDLSGANLTRSDLSGAILIGGNLSRAIVSETNFTGANLLSANLSEITYLDRANLTETKLESVKLTDAHLGYVNLEGKNLKRVDLTRARGLPNLRGADLSRAILIEVYFPEVDLREANLSDADLTGADLRGANLHSVDLRRARLKKAHLNCKRVLGGEVAYHGANLSEGNLSEADLGEANLGEADLSKAKLKDSSLRGARLFAANLQEADLRGAKDFVLNRNFVRGARFDARSTDPWSILRGTYSGPRLIYSLLFLSAFMIPYFAKVFYWVAVNYQQEHVEASVKQGVRSGLLSDKVKKVDRIDQTGRRGQLGPIEPNAEALMASSRCRSVNCAEMPVWQLLVGIDEGQLYWEIPFWILPAILILFNIGKAVLTWEIGPMRDEEERSGFAPGWIKESRQPIYEYFERSRSKRAWYWIRYWYWMVSRYLQLRDYCLLFLFHKYFISPVRFIAFMAFFYNAWYWLWDTTVSIPI